MGLSSYGAAESDGLKCLLAQWWVSLNKNPFALSLSKGKQGGSTSLPTGQAGSPRTVQQNRPSDCPTTPGTYWLTPRAATAILTPGFTNLTLRWFEQETSNDN